MNDTIVRGDSLKFALGWNSVTQSYAHLSLAVGATNFNECPSPGGACATSPAGANWALMVRDLGNDIAYYGLTNKVRVTTADDIEGGWDSYAETSQFVISFNTHNPYGFVLYDHGDANLNGDWTDYRFYDRAYGQTYDYPLPQCYYQSQIDHFVRVRRSYYMQFKGSLANANEGQPPNDAWADLYDTLVNNGVGQSSIPYNTYIVN